MSLTISKFQIGKNGITPGVIESLALVFKNHKQVRVSFLKSSGRNRDSMEIAAKQLVEGLSKHQKAPYTYRIIGFTIIINKYTKA